MFNLAEKWWQWQATRSTERQLKHQEKEQLEEIKKKYGVYVEKAKETKTGNYNPNLKMDKLFEQCIDSGVENVCRTEHYCKASFKNGWEVKFWIANKMYGYCSNGTQFKQPDGKIIDFGSSTMPSMYMCYCIKDKIEDF